MPTLARPGAKSGNVANPAEAGDFEIQFKWDPDGVPLDAFALVTNDVVNASGTKQLTVVHPDHALVFYNQLRFNGLRMVEIQPGSAIFVVPASMVQDNTYVRFALSVDEQTAAGLGRSLDDARGITVRVIPPNAESSDAWTYETQPWGNEINCGVAVEIYNKEQSGQVKIGAVNQGWAHGGIDVLLREHGADIEPVSHAAPTDMTEVPDAIRRAAERASQPVVDLAPTPVPAEPEHHSPARTQPIKLTKDERRRVNLQKIAKIEDPQVRAEMTISYEGKTKELDKAGVPDGETKVAVGVDTSSSTGPGRGMNNLWAKRIIPEAVYAAAALALERDRDGNLDLFGFASSAQYYGSVPIEKLDKALRAIERRVGGGTSFQSLAYLVDEFYFTGPKRPAFAAGEDLLVVVATDGSIEKHLWAPTDRAFTPLASKRAFFKVMKLGPGPHAFPEHLDKLFEGRQPDGVYDNIDVMNGLNDMTKASHKHVIYQLTKEWLIPEKPGFFERARPAWITKAAGLLVPADAGELYVAQQGTVDAGGLGVG